MNYKLFGSNTGLYASEVILGAANFGTRKGYGAIPEESEKYFLLMPMQEEILSIYLICINWEKQRK